MKETKARNDRWAYPPFSEWVWKSFDNTKVVNIDDFVNTHKEAQFYIGTDSQTKSHKTTVTTALIAYNWGRGGSVVIHTHKVPEFQSLRQQLISEAMRSLETAWYVNPKISDDNTIVIHLDVNSNLKWRSGQYRDELVGMIMAQGFKPAIKPDSWGSSKVADHGCRR